MSTLPTTAQEPEVEAEVPSPIGGRLSSLMSMLSGRFRFALGLTIAIVLFAFLGPFLTGVASPAEVVGPLFAEPSASAWLGTDNFGRDVFTQLMYGTRTSLIIGFVAGGIATLIGVIVGVTAGFYGGVVEEALMGITNVVITIPPIVVLILLSIAIGSRSVYAIALIIGITSWPWTARAVRAQASSVRTREHVDLARLTGSNNFSLMLWEVLPYMLSYIVMAFVLQLSAGILQEAALSMLGLGPSGSISLGIMLHWALLWESIRTGAWWAFVPPTIFLTLIAFALLLLQSSLDEVFNPRLRRS